VFSFGTGFEPVLSPSRLLLCIQLEDEAPSGRERLVIAAINLLTAVLSLLAAVIALLIVVLR
jgi:hypothetical protein